MLLVKLLAGCKCYTLIRHEYSVCLRNLYSSSFGLHCFNRIKPFTVFTVSFFYFLNKYLTDKQKF